MRPHLMFTLLATSLALPITAAPAFDDRDDQMVCRRDRQSEVGTRMRAPRTCRTRAQWREMEELTQREIDQIRDGQQPQNPNEGGPVPGLDRRPNG
jgi:hypothetical protein